MVTFSLGRLAGALVLAAGLWAPAPAHAVGCKLALVLGLDISSSVNEREYEQQLHGLADALSHPQVIEAITTPEGAGIAVITYEW
ncbi:MAG: DUF1194 domain-containing protein, partial [Pseudomonadota bacterium]